MVAIAVLLLVQVPPVVVEPRVLFSPTHNAVPPLMVPALGNGLMVMSAVATAVPHAVLMV
jgi:hypothetical protein